ncbi:UNVERIFIED_CONTAM: hypothetical protein H355_014466 [Colinus virginianus]|nr:hypothetical protein H355_014466 [Colinus virginianus]
MAEPLGAGMRFAESQLRRHGWKRGRGLGKREDGIARPIRVSVKCGTAGVGHDPAEQFSFHWWEHVFNEAAANIAVRDGQDEVCVEMLSEQRFGVSTKKPHKVPPPRGSALYGRFVKAATLTALGEEPTKQQVGSESREEEEEKLDRSSARRHCSWGEGPFPPCPWFCCRGARHGLTMTAKLARLEQQERAFLAAMHRGGGQPESPHGSATAEKEKKKKKRKWSLDGADVEGLQSQEQSRGKEEAGERRVGKRKKKKRKKDEVANTEVLPEDTSGPGGAEYNLGERRKKKRQREAE